MQELTSNLEPGNPDGHTVLRYLVEAKQMPLEVAIERVYKAVGKYAANYRSDQNKLLTGVVITGVLGLPVFFPFGVPSLLVAGAIGAIGSKLARTRSNARSPETGISLPEELSPT